MRQRIGGFGDGNLLGTAITAEFSENEVLDLVEAMPFLAPVLPVPAYHSSNALLSHRTPRKSSRVIATHRHHNHNHNGTPRNSDCGTPKATARLSKQRQSSANFGLSSAEVDLATRVWLQVLGDVTVQTLSTSAAFSKACSASSILHEPDELVAALSSLHVPVLPLIRDLAKPMLTLLRDPSWTTQKPGIHFLQYLKLLSQCKHLDALRRHRARQQRSARCQSPPHESFGEPSSTEEGLRLCVVSDDPTEPLTYGDVELLFEYLHSEVDLSASSTTAVEDPTGSSPPPSSVAAKRLQSFGEAFSLSAAGLFPSQLLLVEYPQVKNSARSRSDSLAMFLDSSADLEASHTARSRRRESMAAVSRGPPAVSLLPGVAEQTISLKGFANFINEEEESDVSFVHATMGDASTTLLRDKRFGEPAQVLPPSTMSRVTSKQMLSLPLHHHHQPNASPHHSNDPTTTSGGGLSPMVSANPPTTGVKKGPTPLLPPAHSNAGPPAIVPRTAMEKRSAFSTLQIPPSTYTSFVESKQRKKEQREREAQEAMQRLLHPPRKVPPKSPSELFASLSSTASRVMESVRVASSPLEVRCQTAMSVLRSRRCATPEGATDSGIRTVAASRLLEMLDTAASEDTLLGLQQRQKAYSAQRGMSGMGSRCHTPMPLSPPR